MKNLTVYIHKIKNEYGFTLIEVLASTALLTLVLVIFITVMIQSTKINQTSRQMVDATYVAQSEMEKIYSQSKKADYRGELESVGQALMDLTYAETSEQTFVKILPDQSYEIEVSYDPIDQLDPLEEMRGQIYRVNFLLKVFEESIAKKNLQAQMEHIILWEAE